MVNKSQPDLDCTLARSACEQAGDTAFLVVRNGVLNDGALRPVVAVDGPVVSADEIFDHHATGEPINLLAIPSRVPRPATIATTQLDTDAIISAAVVLLRAYGHGNRVDAVWGELYEAAHYCDHLIPSCVFR